VDGGGRGTLLMLWTLFWYGGLAKTLAGMFSVVSQMGVGGVT